MRQSIVLKSFIILLALAAIGGAVVWGLAQSTEVRGETAVQEAVRDAGLSIPARGAYIIPSGMRAALSSSRGPHPGTDDATMPLKGGDDGHERTHDRDPR